jgi:3-hydroxymyristoyl/3-hydroxydecanoyl-(acyl carrier protein) dehydratase
MGKPLTLRFRIDVDDPCFEGHFPGYPIYPAVKQLSLVAETVSLMRGSPCAITTITAAKFLRPVGPGSLLGVEVIPEGENSAAFKIDCADEIVAKGKLNYRISAL